ncbi:MAG TPA: GSU2403 family nucleotidyltransferase fold protein [Lacipirellulaceae bacterium]|nr:GSU2403 family nucleotidyltransferase fold protein [Lacipirellulaceae bacterium]
MHSKTDKLLIDMKYTPEQLRVLEDLAVAYDASLDATRRLDQLGPILQWRELNGVDYLYERRGAHWTTSRGRRSAATEAMYQADADARSALNECRRGTGSRLNELSALYRALRLPRLPPVIGKICREADRRGLLGTSLMIVGTNAMPAYEVEAQVRFADGLTATHDCHLAWVRRTQLAAVGGTASGPKPVFALLKNVDPSFTVNLERPFLARDSHGYEVELLTSPTSAKTLPDSEDLRPVPLPEQEWLLNGRQVSHVVFDQDNLPMRLVVPDPRWMALHKLWISEKRQRNPKKVEKDREQGKRLAIAVTSFMRAFPVDAEFRAMVPAELTRFLSAFPEGPSTTSPFGSERFE